MRVSAPLDEPDRVSVSGNSATTPGPADPFAVHVNTVRRLDREPDDFVKTYLDSVQSLGSGKTGYSFPVDLGDGIDPHVALSAQFFANTENGPGGWYPLGSSRTAHGGVHLHGPPGKEVHAIADGEVIGFRTGEDERAKAYGSRNFVLLRHKLGDKPYFSLYYHLAVEPNTDAAPGWLKLALLWGKSGWKP
jgi:murein DD-endopeptidase MepM/ murein hydrolase activator NlpD